MVNGKALWEAKPDKRIIPYWVIINMLSILVILFFVGALLALPFMLLFDISLGLGILIIFVILLLASYGWFVLLYGTYKYKVTEDGVSFEGGIIIHKIRNVPYHKITDVTISKNLIERIFGLSSLNVQTAGSSVATWWGGARAEVRFQGMKKPEEIRDMIMARVRKFQRAGAVSE